MGLMRRSCWLVWPLLWTGCGGGGAGEESDRDASSSEAPVPDASSSTADAQAAEAPPPCADVDCGVSGVCVDTLRGPRCFCESGGMEPAGTACGEASDRCAEVECGAAGRCVDVDGAGHCLCDAGHVEVAGACAPIVDGCADVDCGAHGVCALVAGETRCVCEGGYAESAGTCVPAADACAGTDCGEHGACALIAGQARCVCDAGHAETPEGCTPIADACADFDCGAHGACGLVAGEARCLCDAGFVESGDGCALPGDACAGVDCGANALCTAVGAVARCRCEDGFVDGGEGCAPSADPCADVDCDGHGLCAVAGALALCVCDAGFTAQGARCVAAPRPCEGIDCDGHGRCVVDAAGEPVCVCDAGYLVVGGSGCELAPAPCVGEDCAPGAVCLGVDCSGHGACVATVSGARCLCEAGWVAEGTDCVAPVDDPCAAVDCSGRGACIDAPDGPICFCDQGFLAQGAECVAALDPCGGVDCGAGACVVAAAAQARCLCDAGFEAVGLECQEVPGAALPERVDSDVASAEPHPEAGVDYVPNELGVYVIEDHDAVAAAALFRTVGATPAAWDGEHRRYTLRFAEDTTYAAFAAAKASIEADPNVEFAVETLLATAARIPVDLGWGAVGLVDWDDPARRSENWYLKMIRAPEAWDTAVGTTVDPVKIGIIDTDAADDPDLELDPRHTATCGARVREQPNHGEDVAGLAAARGNNVDGLTGVVWNSELYYCETDHTDVCFFYCMQWLINEGVQVVNYSAALGYRNSPCWGDPWTCEFEWGAAPEDVAWPARIDSLRAWNRHLGSPAMLERPWILVQAAGNEALTDAAFAANALALKTSDTLGVAEALKERLVVVGAVGRNRLLASYSNRGDVTLLAPGGDGEDGGTQMRTLSGTARYGTSFAAPLVSGAAALLWSIKPDLTPAEVVGGLTAGGEGALLDVAAAVDAVVGECVADGTRVNPETGRCVACVPSCAGVACGADDGCGDACEGLSMRRCEGNTLVTCDNGEERSDCGEFGRQCLADPTAGGVLRCVFVEAADAPPSGRIVAPADGATISEDFEVEIVAEDDVSIEILTVHVADASARVFSESIHPGTAQVSHTTATIDTTQFREGYHWIAVWADDGVNPPTPLQVIAVDFRRVCEERCAEMVRIPAVGAETVFTMGSPAGEAFAGVGPAHEVTLTAYHIDPYETTVADYRECLDTGACDVPSAPPGNSDYNWNAAGRDDHPINGVSWLQANTYCDWAGKRLCTEAEWERAASGPVHRAFPWGSDCPVSWGQNCVSGEWNPVTARANCGESYCHDGQNYTAPVGAFPRDVSPDGVYDVGGNLTEWVWDCYVQAYGPNGRYPADPQIDPRGPNCGGGTRTLRGGHYQEYPLVSRNQAIGSNPGTSFTGFRCCR